MGNLYHQLFGIKLLLHIDSNAKPNSFYELTIVVSAHIVAIHSRYWFASLKLVAINTERRTSTAQ